MLYTCRFCEDEFEFKNQQSCASHSAHCKSNPNVINNCLSEKLKLHTKLVNPISEYKFNCKKCNTEYTLKLKLTDYERGEYSKHCSRKCSNSRYRSDEFKLKMSQINTNNPKVLATNCNPDRIKLAAEKRQTGFYLKNINHIEGGENNKQKLYFNGVCVHCNENIISKHSRNKKYHYECWKKCFGGLNINSTIVHRCIYNGIKLDSGTEKQFAMWLDCNNIKWIKNTTIWFEYLDHKNKQRKYFPDFYLPDFDQWIETKGKFYGDKDINLKLKLNAVPNIKLIYTHQLKHLVISDVINSSLI